MSTPRAWKRLAEELSATDPDGPLSRPLYEFLSMFKSHIECVLSLEFEFTPRRTLERVLAEAGLDALPAANLNSPEFVAVLRVVTQPAWVRRLKARPLFVETLRDAHSIARAIVDK
jgi:hypothetical protein